MNDSRRDGAMPFWYSRSAAVSPVETVQPAPNKDHAAPLRDGMRASRTRSIRRGRPTSSPQLEGLARKQETVDFALPVARRFRDDSIG